MKAKNYKITDLIKLKDRETDEDFGKKSELEDELEEVSKKLADLQDRLYAHDRYAVLICIQGMDTAGKDSLIREVFKKFNARGVVVHSFKVPTEQELGHDFLWRHYIALPEKGKFGIFNRTHYENVLVTRVHPEYLLNENLPGIKSVNDVSPKFWDMRFRAINDFEKHLAENGTIIFKFFLHISKKEQKQRLMRRLDKEDKNWKFSPADLKERQLWDDYQRCYEDAINNTSKVHAPWYIIPADDKPTARLILARILLEELTAYNDIKYPKLDVGTKSKIDVYKKQLQDED